LKVDLWAGKDIVTVTNTFVIEESYNQSRVLKEDPLRLRHLGLDTKNVYAKGKYGGGIRTHFAERSDPELVQRLGYYPEQVFSKGDIHAYLYQGQNRLKLGVSSTSRIETVVAIKEIDKGGYWENAVFPNLREGVRSIDMDAVFRNQDLIDELLFEIRDGGDAFEDQIRWCELMMENTIQGIPEDIVEMETQLKA